MKSFVLFSLLGAGLTSSAQHVGGPCTYKTISGQAKILSIETAPADQYNCGSSAKVITVQFYTYKNKVSKLLGTGQITLSGGQNPSETWVKTNKIKVGKRFKCIKKEIKTGTCTPIIYEFPTLPINKGCTE